MIKHCENCGGQVKFSPEDKGNKCQNCGSIFPVDYIYEFNKKSFEESKNLKADPLAKEMKTVKCNSCGASIVMDKHQLQNYCR